MYACSMHIMYMLRSCSVHVMYMSHACILRVMNMLHAWCSCKVHVMYMCARLIMFCTHACCKHKFLSWITCMQHARNMNVTCMHAKQPKSMYVACNMHVYVNVTCKRHALQGPHVAGSMHVTCMLHALHLA